MLRKSKKFRITRKNGLVLVAALILVAVVLFFILRSSKTVTTIPVIHTQSQTSRPATSTGDKSSPSPKDSSQPTPVATSSSPPTSSVPSTPPASPSGSFVSNHHASLTSSPGEESTCITSPGASCYIEFTNGSTTHKLPVQITDSSGATVWDWKIQDAKLTAGTWQITAVAELNNQTRSTSGAPLEVTQ